MGTEGRAPSWVESLSGELPRLGPPLPLPAPSCPARRRRLVRREMATQPGGSWTGKLSVQASSRVGGGEYLKKPRLGLEGGQLEVGAAGTGGWPAWQALQGSERTAMSWTHWPEPVMASSAPQKAHLALWRCGWGRGEGGKGGHRSLRAVAVCKLCSEA